MVNLGIAVAIVLSVARFYESNDTNGWWATTLQRAADEFHPPDNFILANQFFKADSNPPVFVKTYQSRGRVHHGVIDNCNESFLAHEWTIVSKSTIYVDWSTTAERVTYKRREITASIEYAIYSDGRQVLWLKVAPL